MSGVFIVVLNQRTYKYISSKSYCLV